MSLIKRAILAFALMAGIAPAFAQVPAAVPALPDSERRTSYSISATTCACNVNFALFGDGTDYQNWVEVFINGVRYDYNDASFGWTITSPSGALSGLARPITNAVLTFNAVQTGTVQIVGARRPRRTSQFSENAGVSARNINQVLTDIISQNREVWDKNNDMTGRGLFSQPGNTMGLLPLPSACINGWLNFGSNGLTPTCLSGGPGSGNVVGPGSSVDGDFVLFNGITGALVKDGASTVIKSATQNLVWASPNGSTGAPTFRALVGADLPNPSASTLGGIQSVTCGASNWISSLSTLGVPGCTQPGVSNLSGFGTGVATALGVNIGSAGAFVTFNGALGTPSSGTLTSATGLPVSTGITGLGTGIATALGVNVGTAGSPVINGGVLGTPSSGTATNLSGTAASLTAGNVTTNANLTGPVTSVGNATTIGANQVSRANLAQGVARSVVGVTGNATANVADIQGTANQFLGVNSAGTALAFATMSQDCTLATGVITCLSTNGTAFTTNATAAVGQLPGETTTGSAAAGKVGEYIEALVASGAPVALVTNTGKTVTSISLTAGDWDVTGNVIYNFAATTSVTVTQGGSSLVTNTLDVSNSTLSRTSTFMGAAYVPTNTVPVTVPLVPSRYSLSGTTTVFLVAQATFTVSTANAYGIIRARRVR